MPPLITALATVRMSYIPIRFLALSTSPATRCRSSGCLSLSSAAFPSLTMSKVARTAPSCVETKSLNSCCRPSAWPLNDRRNSLVMLSNVDWFAKVLLTTPLHSLVHPVPVIVLVSKCTRSDLSPGQVSSPPCSKACRQTLDMILLIMEPLSQVRVSMREFLDFVSN